jgi:hypothetical protein
MTEQARYNLQMGVLEERRFPATDYTSDGSFLDEYLIATTRAKQKIFENYNRQQEAANLQRELPRNPKENK